MFVFSKGSGGVGKYAWSSYKVGEMNVDSKLVRSDQLITLTSKMAPTHRDRHF